MKHILCCVMIFSLLVAVCGCTVDLSQSQVTNVENGQEQKQKPESTGDEKDKGNEGETGDFVLVDIGGGETGTSEIELPVGLPPVVIPPVVVQPVVTLPVVPPTVIVNPVIVKPVIVPPEDAPVEGGGETGETPVVVIPITVPPVVVPPAEAGGGEGGAKNLLMLNELRTELAVLTKHAEYIEFKATAAGNLNGLRLYIMYDATNPFVYNFPAVTVAEGEYITLHLQTLESGCVDELGDNLSLSGGFEACPTARDLWVAGTSEVLHKTDIVYLQDANGRIIDAVVLNEKPGATWNSKQSHFADITERLFNAAMWKSPTGAKPAPFDAVNTSAIGTAHGISVSRDEDMENTHSANDWYITGIGGITPGKANK